MLPVHGMACVQGFVMVVSWMRKNKCEFETWTLVLIVFPFVLLKHNSSELVTAYFNPAHLKDVLLK